MGFLTKLDNGLNAFKNAFSSEITEPNFAILNDGTYSYNYETERFGLLGLLGIGQAYSSPIENLKSYYKNTLFLQDCINLYADFASQVRIIEVDHKGNEIEDSEYLRLLQEPNAWQNQTQFIKEAVINLLTTGVSIQYGNYFKNGNLRISPQLFNIDFNNLALPEIKNKYNLSRKDISELTVKEHLADSKYRNLKFYELNFFYDTIPYNGFGEKGYNSKLFLNPISRLFSIQTSLETLINSQSTMAYLSGNNVNKILSKDVPAGSVAPLPSDQKADIERKVNGRGNYGAKNGKVGDVIASNESLKALDLTRDNRKMQIIEMQENAKENVRNCLLIPKDFFGDSTYENKQMSEARFIMGQVKNITDSILQGLTNKTPNYFQERGTKLIGTYYHLPSVAETVEKLENDGFLSRANALDKAITTFTNMQTIEPTITWEDFLVRHQFNDYLKIGV